MIYKRDATVQELNSHSGEIGADQTRFKLRRMLVLISFLTLSLMLMLLAYGGVGAFAVEDTVEGIDEEAFVQDAVSDLNAYWAGEFSRLGYPYRPANLTFVYDKPVDGGCGLLYSEYGPAYCGYDGTLYYPLSWAVPGGQPLEEYGYSAVAMGMAHETGHHVQAQMDQFGISLDPDGWEPIRHELQADCLAGMWSGRADARFGAGGTEAILTALHDLEGPLHGTAEQRISAFGTGYYGGDLSQCLALTV